MVGRDRVAEDAHGASALDVGDRSSGHAEVLEERRLLDVGALGVPIVDLAEAGWHFVPLWILVCEAGVEFLENLGLEGGLHFVADFLEAWPDVFQENINAGAVFGDWFGGEVDIHAAGERVGDDERGRHEEVGADVLVNAGLEVAVAREDGGGDEVVLHDRGFDLGSERAGVADAGRAAVADDLEAELVEVRLEAGGLKVVLHNAGAGSEGGLDGGIDAEAAAGGFFREEAGADHHARVASVCAACDGGNQNRAVAEVEVTLGVGGGDGIRRWAVIDHFSLVGGLRDVAFDCSRLGEVVRRLAVSAFGHGLREQAGEGVFEIRDIDAVLRALGTCHAGLDGREVEVDINAVFHVTFFRHAEEVLGLEIVLERAALFGRAAGGGEVVDGFGINREEAHGGAIFGGHVCDRCTVGERECDSALAVELDKFSNHLCGAEELGDMEGEVGRGDAFAESVGEVHAHNLGSQEINGLAEHSRLGFDATHAPADDTEAVDHGRVGIGADERVGVVEVAGAEHAFREILEVHLVNDTNAGRNDAESFECLLAPFEKLVALAVALEFHIQIELESLRRAVEIHLHRVIHDEIDGHERLDDGGIAAEAFHRGAHGRKVHQERHTGEILKHDASNDKGNFLLCGRLRIPVRERLDITRLDFFAVAVAEDGFENNADADWEFGDWTHSCFFECWERMEVSWGVSAGVKGAERVEWRGHREDMFKSEFEATRQ